MRLSVRGWSLATVLIVPLVVAAGATIAPGLTPSPLHAWLISLTSVLLGVGVLGLILRARLLQVQRRIAERVAALGGSTVAEDGTLLERTRDHVEHLIARWSRTEMDLDMANKMFGALAESLRDGVVIVDREARVLRWNEPALTALRLNGRLAAGRKIWEAVRLPALSEAILDVIANPAGVGGELRQTEASWDRVLVFSVSPIPDASGAALGAVAVVRDVTELRRMDRIQQDFVANVSHELKTPVAALQTLLDTLREAPNLPAEKGRRFLDRMQVQVERMSMIIGDILSLARVESLQARVSLIPVDVRAALDGVIGETRARAERNGQSFVAELTADEAMVQGDADLLRQIAGNLLDNALKYTPAGGRVAISTSKDAGSLLLVVEDTGPGIEPIHQQRVFERFYRADPGRSRDAGGTGLGLSIVRQASQAMGGTVELVSTPGSGCRFTVRLPLLGSEAVESVD